MKVPNIFGKTETVAMIGANVFAAAIVAVVGGGEGASAAVKYASLAYLGLSAVTFFVAAIYFVDSRTKVEKKVV